MYAIQLRVTFIIVFRHKDILVLHVFEIYYIPIQVLFKDKNLKPTFFQTSFIRNNLYVENDYLNQKALIYRMGDKYMYFICRMYQAQLIYGYAHNDSICLVDSPQFKTILMVPIYNILVGLKYSKYPLKNVAIILLKFLIFYF